MLILYLRRPEQYPKLQIASRTLDIIEKSLLHLTWTFSGFLALFACEDEDGLTLYEALIEITIIVVNIPPLLFKCGS